MAVKIRLSRGGSKKRPFYRLVIADARAPRDGDFIEKVGTYNPLLLKDDAERVILKSDRITHWLNQGAKPTLRVAKFIEKAGIELPKAVVKKMEVLKKAQTTKPSRKEIKELKEKSA